MRDDVTWDNINITQSIFLRICYVIFSIYHIQSVYSKQAGIIDTKTNEMIFNSPRYLSYVECTRNKPQWNLNQNTKIFIHQMHLKWRLQSGGHFIYLSIQLSLQFVPQGPIDNNPPLVQIMAWRQTDDKPLSEPMMAQISDAYMQPLLWRHNGWDGVSNHQPHDCLLNRLFRHRSKKTSAPPHWPLCGEFTGDRWIPRTNDQ